MFLKSLEIYGFKSFADRTHIKFADGITALLGPNGCGKSNVVDAIKWVLAENKSKNLRADSMEDVIFNGTETRPALSMAEVTLTISNDKGLLPLDDSEISIKRRLYRSGEGEYFINGNQVGATTIRKLFLDTGIGKASYSIIEQGKISQLLTAKPEERRYLFEEAAGISRSKAEVAEAERELEKTKANLSQIEIALADTKRRYETLKVQAEKTTKYRKFKDDKFNYELDIQLLKLKDFTQQKARHEKLFEEATIKRDNASKEIEEIFNTLAENNDKIKALEEEIDLKQKEVIKLNAEQIGKKNLAKQLHTSQNEAKEKIGQIENRIKNLKERIEEYNEDIDNQNAELHEKNKSLETINKNMEVFATNIQQSRQHVDENEKTINTNYGKIHNLDNERLALQKELESITEDIVTELDAKLKDAGYNSASNKKAKEELNLLLEKIKVFVNGRTNIFNDFVALPNHSEKDSQKFGTDAVQAFSDLYNMLQELTESIDNYTKTSPEFIDDFLSPEGIITKKRSIDQNIQENLQMIETIKSENEELDKLNSNLSKKINEYSETLNELKINQAEMAQQITFCQQQISNLKRTITSEENTLRELENDYHRETEKKNDLAEQINECEEEIAELQHKGEKIAMEIISLDQQIRECNNNSSGKEDALKKKQEERNKYQSQLEKCSIEIIQFDTEIKNVKQNFQENNSRDLMEFEERMYTITSSNAELKEKLSKVKQQMQELGQVNMVAVEEFAEEKERYERQQESYNDTQKTLENLVRVSEEIKTKSTEMFLDTYNKIRKNFHNMFRRLFNGGRAELKLNDPANVLTSGIEIYAQPPGKKLENISLLSGGEQTMTTVALVFATYQVRPSPFCLLDEIDAALDDKNVSSLVNTLRSFSNVSQYTIITHNRKTVVAASSLLGITMKESGITTVVQIRLDDDTKNGNVPFEEEDSFIEEDVAPEEGIVIPPRPPRRNKKINNNVSENGEEKLVNNEEVEAKIEEQNH